MKCSINQIAEIPWYMVLTIADIILIHYLGTSYNIISLLHIVHAYKLVYVDKIFI